MESCSLDLPFVMMPRYSLLSLATWDYREKCQWLNLSKMNVLKARQRSYSMCKSIDVLSRNALGECVCSLSPPFALTVMVARPYSGC